MRVKMTLSYMNKNAQKILDWLAIEDEPQKADLIFVFGGSTLEIPEKARQLYEQGYAGKILLVGVDGTYSNPNWTEPIALVFQKYLLGKGIPAQALITIPKSTNTLEDVLFSKEEIAKLSPKKIILVTKPVHQRRAYATILKQLPEYEYINQPSAMDLVIDNDEYTEARCIGEIDRLQEYAKKGDIHNFDIPDEIINTYRNLKYC